MWRVGTSCGFSTNGASGINFDGFRLAAGGELPVGQKVYFKLEQRYGNYDYGVELYQTVIGAGIRF